MVIAVMSDLHDNVTAWRVIAKYLEKNTIPFLINCGDTCAPAMLKEMSGTYAGHIDTVFGNVADKELEAKIVTSLPNVTHHGEHGLVTLGGRRIFFNHYPARAEEVALSGDVDLACHGHTHLKRWEQRGQAWLLNPGTAGGMFQYPSFAVLDLDQLSCEFHEVTL